MNFFRQRPPPAPEPYDPLRWLERCCERLRRQYNDRVPLGYEKDGATLRTSDDAPVMVLIFTMYATGRHSHLTIAEELNRRDLTVIDIYTKLRGPFSADTVGGILGNPAYIGTVCCGGKEYQGAHPPLVDRGLYNQCQEIRGRRKRQGDLSGMILPGSSPVLTYLAPGANNISLFAASSTVTATLSWQNCYNGLSDLVQ